jgi:hypothetical protein
VLGSDVEADLLHGSDCGRERLGHLQGSGDHVDGLVPDAAGESPCHRVKAVRPGAEEQDEALVRHLPPLVALSRASVSADLSVVGTS